MAVTYEPIATTTLSSALTYAEFTSIPQTYTDLVVVSDCKYTSGGGDINLRFNTTGGTSYSYQRMVTNGSTFSSGHSINNSMINNTDATPATITVHNIFGYTSTSQHKCVITYGGSAGTSGNTGMSVGIFRSASAVSSIQIYAELTGATWAIGSTFTLYGILKA